MRRACPLTSFGRYSPGRRRNAFAAWRRMRVVCMMPTIPMYLLLGLLIWSFGTNTPTQMTTSNVVMAFATTSQWRSPPKTLLSFPSPYLHPRRNMYDTALQQEAHRRHTTASSTTTTTNMNQRFKYKYLVDTIPSFFIPQTSTASSTTKTTATTRTKPLLTTTSSKKVTKFIPMTSTSRLLRKRQKQLQKTLRHMNSDLLQLIETITTAIAPMDRIYDILYTCIIPFWYLLPSTLCFVPIYTLTVWQTIPVTPDVWKLVNMDFIWWYYTHKHHAISVICTFLASNASFFLAALFLLKQSKPIAATTSTSTATTGSTITTDTLKQKPLSINKVIPSSLGYWVLAAGIMSTIFHTVQACGNYRIAEALCYLDHGVAGTAICHFYSRCGIPSLRTILCGIVAFIILAFPITSIHLPSYTTLHSLWHTLAAATALLWAYDATHSPHHQPKRFVEQIQSPSQI